MHARIPLCVTRSDYLNDASISTSSLNFRLAIRAYQVIRSAKELNYNPDGLMMTNCLEVAGVVRDLSSVRISIANENAIPLTQLCYVQ
jgi:hypothetical protein